MDVGRSNRRNRLTWHRWRRHQSNVPHGTEGIPRFQPSAAALGAATAQQILDELRKQLEGVDLKKDAPKKRVSKKG